MNKIEALYRAYEDLQAARRAYDQADDDAFKAAQARDAAASVRRQREEVLRVTAASCGFARTATTNADVLQRARVALSLRNYLDPPDFVAEAVFAHVDEALAEFAPAETETGGAGSG